jgi:hypothetical protein
MKHRTLLPDAGEVVLDQLMVEDSSPEQLRLALLQARRSGAGKLRRFEALLLDARHSLRARNE